MENLRKKSRRRIPGIIISIGQRKDPVLITGTFSVSGSATFTDANECIEYILSITDEPIFFVLQNIQNNCVLVAVAQDLPQVHSIYIYGEYSGMAHTKIMCITYNISELKSKLSNESL